MNGTEARLGIDTGRNRPDGRNALMAAGRGDARCEAGRDGEQIAFGDLRIDLQPVVLHDAEQLGARRDDLADIDRAHDDLPIGRRGDAGLGKLHLELREQGLGSGELGPGGIHGVGALVQRLGADGLVANECPASFKIGLSRFEIGSRLSDRRLLLSDLRDQHRVVELNQ